MVPGDVATVKDAAAAAAVVVVVVVVVAAVVDAAAAAAGEMASSVGKIVGDAGHLEIDAVGRALAEPMATGPKDVIVRSSSRKIRAAERVAGLAYTRKNAEDGEYQVSWKAV